MPFVLETARWIRRAVRRPLKAFEEYRPLFRDKDGLEVGGPSELFRRVLPIYEAARSVDGVNFSSNTVWEGHLRPGMTYRFMRGRVGRQFICEATELSEILSEQYDFVISSNSLEHIANPLKAITEWIRVTRVGGHLVIVLPRKESNFDHNRNVTEFSHLLQDFTSNTSEHDLTHLPEILDLHDYSMDPPAVNRETMKSRSLLNFENRCLHHHVFDASLITRTLEHFQLKEVMQTVTVTDYIVLAQKLR
jgi:SAM-dependent methyltransferase